ncbi:MAG: hypothetical protein ACUVUS_07195 [Thermoproteota archaeon]
MRACKHFRYDGTFDTHIIPIGTAGPCTRVSVHDEDGDVLFGLEGTFLWLEYLQHLQESPACAKEVNESQIEVQQHLKLATEEWEKLANGVIWYPACR